jgi:hypothetical protein
MRLGFSSVELTTLEVLYSSLRAFSRRHADDDASTSSHSSSVASSSAASDAAEAFDFTYAPLRGGSGGGSGGGGGGTGGGGWFGWRWGRRRLLPAC